MTERTEKNPRFTVIVPTKDRADYLHHTLRTCALQDYDNLEVIVSDDGSTDHTREVVEEAGRKDKRIRYVSPGSHTGMLENFEFALRQVQPGYVLALGGDDGLLPYGITGMRDCLQESGLELLAWPTPAFFYPKVGAATGQLILHTIRGALQRGRRVIESRDFLARQTEHLHYVGDVESPMFYVKGVASTRLVDQVKARTPGGRFYSCSTPDGYSGIVLAGEVERYAFSGEPFSIHGVSPSSHGMSYLAARDDAKKQSEEFFKKAVGWPMHRELGSQAYSPLISLMTVDFLLTCKDLPGWQGEFPPIDYRRLLTAGLHELANGLFAEDRVTRELAILYGVAEHRGLGEHFRRQVKATRRNRKTQLEGNAFSPVRTYLDAGELGIKDVFDAAYVAHYAHRIVPRLNLSMFWGALMNSIKYKLQARQKGSRFPDESDWMSR